jgi:Zn-dependent metalloprotease
MKHVTFSNPHTSTPLSYKRKGRGGFMKRKRIARLCYSVLATSLMMSVVPLKTSAASATTVEMKAEPVKSDQAAWSNTKISQEKAVELAKKVAGNLEGFDEPQVSRGNDMRPFLGAQNAWEIRWIKRGPQFSNVEVLVDAETGMILNFNRDENDQAASFPPKFSYEDAVQKAKDFLAANYKELIDQLQLDTQNNAPYGKVIRNPQDAYEVRFIEKVNGIPFSQNQLSIRINGNGEVVSLNFHDLKNVKFEDSAGMLSQEEIMKKLQSGLQMKLAYQTQPIFPESTQQSDNPKSYYTYDPSPQTDLVNAKTGESMDYLGNVRGAQPSDDKPLAESKQADPPAKLAHALTQEEAVKRLGQLITIPEDVTVSSIQQRDFDKRKVWDMQMDYHSGNSGMGWSGGMVDAETGEVIQLEMTNYVQEKLRDQASQPSNKQEKKSFSINLDQAQEKALAFIKANCQDKLHQLYFSGQQIEQPTEFSPFYRFQFERRINGVLVPANSISIAISAETGKVMGFHQFWDWNIKLPDTKDFINPAKAKEIYLKDIHLGLEYQIVNEKQLYLPGSIRKDLPPAYAKLVYRIQTNHQEPVFLDATTGKWISAKTGKEVQGEDTENIQDLKGHWAEKELQYLVKIGAMEPEDGKIHPDQKLTRGEFIDLLSKMIQGPYGYPYYPGVTTTQTTYEDVPVTSKYFGTIEWAVEQGILQKEKDFRPDNVMTREEAAHIIVSALGYAKIAGKSQIFRLNFSDQKDIDYPGDVAILSGIGIMDGYAGKFQPDQPLTRAQAAVVLFKYLQNKGQYRPDVRM